MSVLFVQELIIYVVYTLFFFIATIVAGVVADNYTDNAEAGAAAVSTLQAALLLSRFRSGA